MRVTDTFVEVSERTNPRVPALRGKTIALLFFEESTRTRLSFEIAGKRLSADVVGFSGDGSSMSKKGESLRDTIETISAMGPAALVVRHKLSGVPAQITQWTNASVINAGDGWHEHPTQALLDCYTLRQARGAESLEGVQIAIVGDVMHSRVARSGIAAFTMLGADVTVVAPPTLLPPSFDGWSHGAPVQVSHDLDDVLQKADVVYPIRLQQERIREALLPSVSEYAAGYGLTANRARALPAETIVLDAGPMIRGVHISSEMADRPNTLVTQQVANGVAVRMALLFLLLGSGGV